MNGSSVSVEALEIANPLPRELTPGLFWLGQCQVLAYKDELLHGYNSVYLVAGEHSSVLVECGPPMHLATIERQLDQLLEQGVPPVRYLFPSHPETNHASGVGRLLAHFPEARMIGDPTDFHLAFPEFSDRISELAPNTSIDLGGREFECVPAVFRDHRSTRWGFDHGSRALFSSDGLAFTHYHQAGQCGRTAEECEDLDIAAMTELFTEAAFYWTRFNDIEPYLERLDALVERFDVKIIGPTHGLPTTDVPKTLEQIRAGYRAGGDAWW